MSGGVDSAVALHRAGPRRGRRHAPALAGPRGAGHRARLLLAGRGVRGARRPVTRSGRPHVTLDLREEFKGAIVDPFTRAYARGETPNPCMRCNGAFRFDALVEFAERAGAEELWTGHYARIVERDGMKLVARGARREQGPVVHARGGRSGAARARALPARESRRRRRRARRLRHSGWRLRSARRARRRASSAATTTARSSRGRGSSATSGPIVDVDGATVGEHDGYWRFTPGQRRGLRVAADRPLYVLRNGRRDEHRHRRLARAARRDVRRDARDGCIARWTRAR